MRRLSLRQNFLLDQLRGQGKRIEKLFRIEHDLTHEVDPPVNEIKEGMQEMIAVLKENSEDNPPASLAKAHWIASGLAFCPPGSGTMGRRWIMLVIESLVKFIHSNMGYSPHSARAISGFIFVT